VLFGEARTGQGCGQGNFERGDYYGGFADGFEVFFEIGGRELGVCAGIDGNEICPDGVEEDDAYAGGQRFGVENFFAVDVFAIEHSDEVGGERVAAELAEEKCFGAEAGGGDGGVGTFAAEGGVEVAADNGFAFDGEAVHVHDEGYDVAADYGYAAAGCGHGGD